MQNSISIPVKVWANFKHEHGLPKYATLGAGAMDVRSNEELVLLANTTSIIPTGIYMALPDGYKVNVLPRSGMSLKTFFRVANAPGLVDSDYRGELCIIANNIGEEDIPIPLGERIAQIEIAPTYRLVWDTVMSREDLPKTERGAGGFGSTGTK